MNPKCPYCKSDTYKNGHHKDKNNNKIQNYLCKNNECKKQFQNPDKVSVKIKCPKCGKNMHKYKYGSIHFRYRCSDRKNCNHKMNIPISDNLDLPSDIIIEEQNEKYTDIHFSRLHFSKETFSIVIFFSICIALPSETISRIMLWMYNIEISADTIDRWNIKVACVLHNRFKHHKYNTSVWNTDETFLYHNRHKILIAIREPNHKLILMTFYSKNRNTKSIATVFNIAKAHSKTIPKEIIVDGWKAYPPAFNLIFKDQDTVLSVYKGLQKFPNNNCVERQHGYFKDILRRYRGITSELGLKAFLLNQSYFYNYCLPQADLGNLTPAQHAGVNYKYRENPWKMLLYFISAPP